MALNSVASLEALVDVIQNHDSVVVHMTASWNEPCRHMDAVLEVLAAKHSNVHFVKVDAEEVPDVAERYNIVAVPHIIMLKDGQEVDKLEGADAAVLTAKVTSLASTAVQPAKQPPTQQANGAGTPPPPTSTATPSLCQINKRCSQLVNSHRVMVFMKGDPAGPRCKFSRKVVETLRGAGCIDFGHFDILTDEAVRQGMKQYSNWPTYPQVYVNGELLGGCDIITELAEAGELGQELGVACKVDLSTRLKQLITSKSVMLFMKGTPAAPKCGFSSQVVQALTDAGVDFGTFDILSDDEVRQGLKTYSDWPTYPQLYAGGQLVGGCDIVKELVDAGELKATLAEMGSSAA